MEQIIDSISTDEILSELTEDCFVRKTVNGNNDIYVITAKQQPNIMRELGRLREITFRNAGGGSGKSCDIDDEDLSVSGYKQLFVWNHEDKEIIGGYRYIIIDKEIEQDFSIRNYFDLNKEYIDYYYPHTIELGRSFVQPKYQSKAGGRKSMYALDNLWDGLGAIIAENSNVKYMIGKVTMYSNTSCELKNLLYTVLYKYFRLANNIIAPKKELEYIFDKTKYIDLFDGMDYSEAMKFIIHKARKLGENYPPLFAAYANLSNTMKVFGTVINPDFGNVLETAIMITISDLKKNKYKRYVASYLESKQ